jgi:LacI family transcriptional regulator
VPGDVSVVGFDDLPSSSYRVPPLTTVRQAVRVLGERSAQAMLQLLKNERPRATPPPVELIVRESTGAPHLARQ